jgi:hypothetical protein
MISLFAAVVATVSSYGLGQILLPEEPIIVIGTALFLGFLTRKLIDSTWNKRQKRAVNADIFPHLKKDALEKWGRGWGQEYEHLNKVVLFDPPLKYPLDIAYILYFDFDTSTPEGKKSQEKFNEINAFQNSDILDSGFQEVYRNKPDPGFRFEWFVTIVKYSRFNDNYSWVIYQKGKRDQSP